MDKLKKSGMDMDMNIEQMDWVEDNKKVRPCVFILNAVSGFHAVFHVFKFSFKNKSYFKFSSCISC